MEKLTGLRFRLALLDVHSGGMLFRYGWLEG
jgi:hypothetical protein